ILFFYSTGHHRDLHSFPTRRSSDLATAFKPRKMNYEVLGNTVGHLHWHLFPRYEWDPNPKRPTWETNHPPRLPSPDEYADIVARSEEHTSELQSRENLVCRLLLEKK